ncbi:helix-turn-helix domain-containing protein [Mycobacteroides abscessus subsp. abscessus]|uniref:helix-turn-helix domain-containing protein n=1 Tax=Mycobacteroides abscessus TaxID=36809 RepID=UPI0039F09FFD
MTGGPDPDAVAVAVTALVAALQATPPAAPEPQKMLTVKETAEMLRCSESLVYSQLKDGRLRGVKIGRRRLVPVLEIQKLIESGGA